MLDNERPHQAVREQALIDEIALRYWNDHAHRLPSAKTANRELGTIQEWWEGKTVADITPDAQRRFRQHLADHGTGVGGIDRVLSTFRAMLNHAKKNQEVEDVPFIFGFRSAEELRSRDPKGRPLSIEEMAALLRAAQSRHALLYLILGMGTLARPAAILDLTEAQYDAVHGILTLNPPGRVQNKKWRPIIPVAPALAQWLSGAAHKETGHFITYRNKPVTSILGAFRKARKQACLDQKVTPYSLRHTMAREMRKARVPGEQISLFLGHLPQGAAATTAIYAPYEPGYLAEAAEAIDVVMRQVTGLSGVTPAVMASGGDGLYHHASSTTGKAIRGGIGDAKREEVRRLILAGVPHAEVVQQTGVSGGTVSVIRQGLKAGRHGKAMGKQDGKNP